MFWLNWVKSKMPSFSSISASFYNNDYNVIYLSFFLVDYELHYGGSLGLRFVSFMNKALLFQSILVSNFRRKQ